jgi:hypothetical protein
MIVNADYFRNCRIGIPGLAVADDPRYLIFNWGHVEQYIDQIDLIQSLVPGAKVIFCIYNDPYNVNHVRDCMLRTGVKGRCFVLTGSLDFAKANHDLGFRFLPFAWHWWYSYHYRHRVAGDPPQQYSPKWHSRSYNLSCLNRGSSFSRFVTYYELQSQSWFGEVYKSFGDVSEVADHVRDNNIVDNNIVDWFLSRQTEFPCNSQTDYDGSNDWCSSTAAYSDTYANLVTETFSQTPLMTEKTVKPLVAGNIIFVAAANDFLSLLKSLKFEVDFEGIDNSYDAIPDWHQRINSMVAEINRVYHALPDIWQQNLPKLKYNREWLLSKDFEKLMLHDVNDLFEHI